MQPIHKFKLVSWEYSGQIIHRWLPVLNSRVTRASSVVVFMIQFNVFSLSYIHAG